MIPAILALPVREVAVETIQTIDISRFANIANASWGGANNTSATTPDIGLTLFEIMGVYLDSVGVIAWVIIFGVPFIAMFLGHKDIVPAGAFGIFFGLYIVAFVPSQWSFFGWVFIALAATSVVWSLWRSKA